MTTTTYNGFLPGFQAELEWETEWDEWIDEDDFEANEFEWTLSICV